MFARAVYVVFVPLVIRMSSIDTWIWLRRRDVGADLEHTAAVLATVAVPLAVMRLGEVGSRRR